MEPFLQNTQIPLGVISSIDNIDDKVYRPTTVQINNNRGDPVKSDRSQSSNYHGDVNGKNNMHKPLQFSNLPSRDAIDLQFKDIAYTVSMGFRKGMYCFFFYFKLLHNLSVRKTLTCKMRCKFFSFFPRHLIR